MEQSELPFSSFVLERYQVVYVPIAKASTTSMKWLMATLNGEDEERFRRAITPQVTRAATIHNRTSWKATPSLGDLPPERLSEIDPGSGWFVFAVTRHPTSRLWSAWQSKFLLRQDLFMKRYGKFDLLPRMPASTSDVVADFASFVAALRGPARAAILRNRHFQPQTELLGHLPYTRIYSTAEVPQVLVDLGAHVKERGGPKLPDLILSNDTPLPLIEPLLTPDVLATVEEVYHEDLLRLGYSDVRPHRVDPAEGFSPAQLREVGRLAERSERVADLSRLAQGLEKELVRARRAARRTATADQPRSKSGKGGKGGKGSESSAGSKGSAGSESASKGSAGSKSASKGSTGDG